MTQPLILVGLWAALALLAGLLRDGRHRVVAAGLVGLGIPLLGWLTYNDGPLVGLLAMAAGAALLRWRARRVLQRRVSVIEAAGERPAE